METHFYILLSLQTVNGFENYGQYFIGNDRDAAYLLFDSLRGTKQLDAQGLLHLDLMEMVDDLPVRIRSVSCTLDQLGENSKLIAREIFRQKNLKVYEG